MLKGMGFKNMYSLTPEMTYSGRPKEDRMQLVVMPEPKDIGHAYAIMMFTDENYDFPGYFMIVLGADDTLFLIAWDYQANVYNLGTIDDPEDAAQIAYESYVYSRENSKQS
jgi:hypothetical protein